MNVVFNEESSHTAQAEALVKAFLTTGFQFWVEIASVVVFCFEVDRCSFYSDHTHLVSISECIRAEANTLESQ